MVSHAHGQGYADMHFLIPEIINNIEDGEIKDFLSKSMNQAVKGKIDIDSFLRAVENLNIKK